MSRKFDPAKENPDYDWRSEVDWPRLNRLIRLHLSFWILGGIELALFRFGALVGTTRTLLGLADYLIWGVLLVMLFPVVSKPRYHDGSNQMVSGPTFLILVALMGSLVGFVFLLNFIDLDTVEVYPNPETGLLVILLTILAAAFVIAGFAVAWRGSCRTRHLIAWMRNRKPGAWKRLPWSFRHMFLGLAIERMRHDAFRGNEDFLAKYDELEGMRRRSGIYVIIGVVCIGIVIFGTSFGGWRW